MRGDPGSTGAKIHLPKTAGCSRGWTLLTNCNASQGNTTIRRHGGNTQMRPFQFGVSVWRAQSRAELVEKARKVEALGYATLTLPDHLTDRIAPVPALAIAAEAAKQLRVGTNVLNNDFRHPVLVARETAAVDLLTDGRFELGLGAGSIRSEYEQVGLDFDRGAVRVERLTEAVTVIKGLPRKSSKAPTC